MFTCFDSILYFYYSLLLGQLQNNNCNKSRIYRPRNRLENALLSRILIAVPLLRTKACNRQARLHQHAQRNHEHDGKFQSAFEVGGNAWERRSHCSRNLLFAFPLLTISCIRRIVNSNFVVLTAHPNYFNHWVKTAFTIST